MSSLPIPTLQIIESTTALNRRLADRARECGVQVLTHRQTGHSYATDHRAPDELHVVTLVSCDCPRFILSGACLHHAALLAHLGQLPPHQPTTPAGRLTVLPVAQEMAS